MPFLLLFAGAALGLGGLVMGRRQNLQAAAIPPPPMAAPLQAAPQMPGGYPSTVPTSYASPGAPSYPYPQTTVGSAPLAGTGIPGAPVDPVVSYGSSGGPAPSQMDSNMSYVNTPANDPGLSGWRQVYEYNRQMNPSLPTWDQYWAAAQETARHTYSPTNPDYIGPPAGVYPGPDSGYPDWQADRAKKGTYEQWRVAQGWAPTPPK